MDLIFLIKTHKLLLLFQTQYSCQKYKEMLDLIVQQLKLISKVKICTQFRKRLKRLCKILTIYNNNIQDFRLELLDLIINRNKLMITIDLWSTEYKKLIKRQKVLHLVKIKKTFIRVQNILNHLLQEITKHK